MSLLNNLLKKTAGEFGSFQQVYTKNTGLTILDYLNGSSNNIDGNVIYNTGVDQGRIVLLVGKAGSGKSSIGIQMGYGLVKDEENASLTIFDFENSNKVERVKELTGATQSWLNEHLEIYNSDIYIETVLRYVNNLAKIKKENFDALAIDNPQYNKDDPNSEKKILPVSVIILDSLALMSSEPDKNYDEDEMFANTYSARKAIAVRDMLTKIKQPMQTGNIILIIINHVTTKISTGPTPTASDTRYLSNTENIPGGRSLLYISNLVLQVTAGKKLEADDTYGIKGFIGSIKIIKSRDSEAGREMPYIFSQKNGYIDELSCFEFLKNNKSIMGAGRGMYIPSMPDVKFSGSNFLEKLKSDKTFHDEFYKFAKSELEKTISLSSRNSEIEETETSEE